MSNNNSLIKALNSSRTYKKLGNISISGLPTAVYYNNAKKNKFSFVKPNTMSSFNPNTANFIFVGQSNRYLPNRSARRAEKGTGENYIRNAVRTRLNKNGGTIIFV
jgi:hypothetical protein